MAIITNNNNFMNIIISNEANSSKKIMFNKLFNDSDHGKYKEGSTYSELLQHA